MGTEPFSQPITKSYNRKAKRYGLLIPLEAEMHSAGRLSKLLENATMRTALEFAGELGAFNATKKGACPDYSNEEISDFIKNDDLIV